MVALVLSVLGSLAFAAYWYVKYRERTDNIFTAEELAKADGIDGRICYVAIDTTVYEITQGIQWVAGKHITSEGQAMCGKDLTQVISKSPHGRSKLDWLPVVGTFKK